MLFFQVLVAVFCFAGAFVLLWVCVLVSAVKAARARGHKGYWWCLYVLGLHALLSPLYKRLGGLGDKRAGLLSAIYHLVTLPVGCEIPLAAQLGSRLLLGHTVGIVVHGFSTIGNDCVITAGVVIGGDGRGGVPHIGDNVFIGANAVVVGPISVGDGATIGAGAVVVKDVPPTALVVGNPGTVVKVPYHRPYHNPEGARA